MTEKIIKLKVNKFLISYTENSVLIYILWNSLLISSVLLKSNFCQISIILIALNHIEAEIASLCNIPGLHRLGQSKHP